ncbi:MAG: gluconate 2-dehydrogenase subunit 3 family protein [Gemmatimonadaceae bacterium]
MSAPSPIRPGSIDRREALRRTALLLGGAISAPTLAAMLAGCETPATGEAGWTPRALTDTQGAQVATIAEHIIPTTDTPGARGAGVHRFIDTMLAEYYSPDERAAFLVGLADVDARARATKGKAFLELSAPEQRDVLALLDAEAYRRAAGPATNAPTAAVRGQDAEENRTEGATADQRKQDPVRPHPEPRRRPFFHTMKELTLLGYYTSEIGATQELKYARVPGRFDGCVPFSSIGRAWST